MCLPVVDAGVLVLCPAPAGRLHLRSEQAWLRLDARLDPTLGRGLDPGNHGPLSLSVIPVNSTELLISLKNASFSIAKE